MKKIVTRSMAGHLALLLAAYILCGLSANGQDKGAKADLKEKSKGFCTSENWDSGDRVSHRELREMTVAAGGTLDVDSGRNGGIKVKGENRSDILVRACVQAWGNSAEEAKSAVSGIKVTTSGGVRAEGAEDSNWGVSFEILVPRNTDLKLRGHNGGISISSVEGNLDFATTNGGVSLWDVAGNVRGRTTNGGVKVGLLGGSWRGGGLDVETTNGGVNLTLPENYAANIEAGTTNGGFSSDFAALNITTEDRKGEGPGRSRATKVNTSINGGGPTIRLMTTNGGIRVNTASNTIKY